MIHHYSNRVDDPCKGYIYSMGNQDVCFMFVPCHRFGSVSRISARHNCRTALDGVHAKPNVRQMC